MKYLISYRCEFRGSITYGMDMHEDPVEWLKEVQELDGIFILLNQFPLEPEQCDMEFKGM